MCGGRKPEIVKDGTGKVKVGRVTLSCVNKEERSNRSKYAHTGHSSRLLECLAGCCARNEPALLVGETRTGKTAAVQHLADLLGRKLIVQNLSQQTDTTDLLGGFKPVELRAVAAPLCEEHDNLFGKTFRRSTNTAFLDRIKKAYIDMNWQLLVSLLRKSLKAFDDKIKNQFQFGQEETQTKSLSPSLRRRWEDFRRNVQRFDLQVKDEKTKNSFIFGYVEGSLVKAIRNGDWVLLDEINLASTETLESLSGLLEGGSVTLSDTGALEPVPRHPNFRVFACMNPPTDVGKKDLPPGLRNRFTEIYVSEMSSKEDLCVVVNEYLKEVTLRPPTDSIVSFYLEAKKLAKTTLEDGSGQKNTLQSLYFDKSFRMHKSTCITI